ncbi:MAG TPA: TIGR04086 family membrane protein [Acidimicrobiales bacterium]|nr:TIGR04086 family membrane protein [Acidimicrobiales bacterium]
MRGQIDWKAVALGGVVTVAVGVLASVVAAVINLSKDSNGWYIFFWIDILGAGVGGYIAGRRRLDTPLMHGALVGACAYVVIAAFATTITLVSGHARPALAQVVFAVLWLALGGTIGGWVASWRAQRTRPSGSTS